MFRAQFHSVTVGLWSLLAGQAKGFARVERPNGSFDGAVKGICRGEASVRSAHLRIMACLSMYIVDCSSRCAFCRESWNQLIYIWNLVSHILKSMIQFFIVKYCASLLSVFGTRQRCSKATQTQRNIMPSRYIPHKQWKLAAEQLTPDSCYY